MRNFMEERRWQLIEEELDRIRDRLLIPREIWEMYRQNPLLKTLLENARRHSHGQKTQEMPLPPEA